VGDRLRPITLGVSGPEAPLPGAADDPLQLVGVHSPRGDLLGYAAFDAAVDGVTRGGITVTEAATLRDAVFLARSAAMQLRLCGLPGGAMHCVVSIREGREGVRDLAAVDSALEPLVQAGACRVDYHRHRDRVEPRFVHDAVVASATAAALSVLTHLSVSPERGSFAAVGPQCVAHDIADALTALGLEDGGQSSPIDLLVVDGQPGTVSIEALLARRARAAVLVGPVSIGAEAEQKLSERGTIVVPEPLSSAGRSIALHLRDVDGDERRVLVRTTARVRRLVQSLLESAERRGESLPTMVRALGMR
jgi:hypothetical protein